VTYAPSVELAGGRAIPVPLAAPDNRLDTEAIAAAITGRTRAVLINTPHNPTGRVFSEAELSALAHLVKERDLWLMCDESFDLFVFDGRTHLSPGVFDAIRDRTILLYSFSKAFALPSYRIGMLAGPEPVCSLVANCTQQLISSVALASQKVAHAALQKETEWAPLLRRTYQDKRDACLALLKQDARDDERHFLSSFTVGSPIRDAAHVVLSDFLTVKVAKNGFEDDPDADRQPGNRPDAFFLKLRQGIKLSGFSSGGGERLK